MDSYDDINEIPKVSFLQRNNEIEFELIELNEFFLI